MDASFQRKQVFAHLYYAKIPKQVAAVTYPTERAEYVAAARSQVVCNQRAFVWQLLSQAMEHSLGINPQTVNFKVKNGVWTCDACCFSLSHTDGYAAVAVSDLPVGVDIEVISTRFNERLFDRIATDAEKAIVKHSPVNTAALWTGKEALFKQSGSSAFVPHFVDTSSGGVVSFSDGKIVLAAATSVGSLEVFCADDNTISKPCGFFRVYYN